MEKRSTNEMHALQAQQTYTNNKLSSYRPIGLANYTSPYAGQSITEFTAKTSYIY